MRRRWRVGDRATDATYEQPIAWLTVDMDSIRFGQVLQQPHGFTKEALSFFLRDLEWLTSDDSWFGKRHSEPPPVLQFAWQILLLLEQEIVRMMSAGPPFEPRHGLDGALILSQVHALFPDRWVACFKELGMPDSLLTNDLLAEWQPHIAEGLPLANGNLLSNHPWSLNDPAWTLVVPYYIALCLDPSIKAPFATNPARIEIADTDMLSLAIVGDWGSGSFADGPGQLCPAEAIMQQIDALPIDYTIHLGDVYPIGSRPFYDNFLLTWKPGRRGSFNINSNHDMYGWGIGYFDQAMRHATFAAQQGTSYFSVDFGEWLIVGLDTAYHDMSPLQLAGAINDTAQKTFLRETIREQAERTGQKIFLLTHNNAYTHDGTATTNIWDDVIADDALGRAPDVWYWGHAHNGIVYSTAAAGGPDVRARCVGHGSLPMAPPIELASHTGPGKPIAGFACTPYPDDVAEHRGRAMNGFATVTLTRDGGIAERFLNQDGTDWHPQEPASA